MDQRLCDAGVHRTGGHDAVTNVLHVRECNVSPPRSRPNSHGPGPTARACARLRRSPARRGRFARTAPKDFRQRQIKHVPVQENQCVPCLSLRRRRGAPISREPRERLRNLRLAQFSGMSFAMEQNASPHPGHIGLLRAQTVVTQPHRRTHFFQEWRFRLDVQRPCSNSPRPVDSPRPGHPPCCVFCSFRGQAQRRPTYCAPWRMAAGTKVRAYPMRYTSN